MLHKYNRTNFTAHIPYDWRLLCRFPSNSRQYVRPQISHHHVTIITTITVRDVIDQGMGDGLGLPRRCTYNYYNEHNQRLGCQDLLNSVPIPPASIYCQNMLARRHILLACLLKSVQRNVLQKTRLCRYKYCCERPRPLLPRAGEKNNLYPYHRVVFDRCPRWRSEAVLANNSSVFPQEYPLLLLL